MTEILFILEIIVGVLLFIKERQINYKVRNLRKLTELDQTHAKHLRNIHDYQIVMFNSMANNDLHTAKIASEQINAELIEVRDVIERKQAILNQQTH